MRWRPWRREPATDPAEVASVRVALVLARATGDSLIEAGDNARHDALEAGVRDSDLDDMLALMCSVGVELRRSAVILDRLGIS